MIRRPSPGRPAPPRLHTYVPAGVASIGAVLLGACAPVVKDGPGASAATEDTVTAFYIYDETAVTPFRGLPAMHLVFLPLFGRDDEGEPEGRLVRDWEISPDGSRHTYHLRTDVRWHDGTSFTARDIEFTVELLQHPAVLREPPGSRTVEVIDDSTVVITFRTRDPGDELLDDYKTYLPAHLLAGEDPASFAEWDFWTRPVGNGPYRYVRHVPKTMVGLEANPDYYRGPSTIDRVRLVFGGDPLVELRSGNVQILPWSAASDARMLEAARDSAYRLYWSAEGRPIRITWNHRHDLLGDVRIRRALSMAINRSEFAVVRSYPPGVVLSDVPRSPRQARRGIAPEPLPYDPAQARRALEELGWRDTDADGIREREGHDLQFSLLTWGWYESMAVLLQSQLRRIGVQADIQILDRTVVQDRVGVGEYDAYIYQGIGRNSGLNAIARGVTGYENTELSELVESMASVRDLDELDRIYEAIWPIWQRDLPETFLLPSLYMSVAHRSIRGLRSPDRVFALSAMDKLWIDETWAEENADGERP